MNGPFYLAEVRNINDPWKSGRVQVRIYGVHDDENNIKDEDLPWAMPLQPITSAATARVGIIPSGMLVGSRVLVTFLDEEKQYPVIMGTYARAGSSKDKNDNTGGEDNTEGKDSDIPSQAGGTGNTSDPSKRAATYNPNVGGTPRKSTNTEDSKYNNAPYENIDNGTSTVKDARKKFAPNADTPTTASADPSKKLPEVVNQVDPQAVSAVLKQMLSMLAMVRDTSNATSPAATTNTVTDALAGALAILADNYGFEKVIKVFKDCLSNGGFSRLEPIYQELVEEAIAQLIQNSLENGPNTLELSETPIVIKQQVGGVVPLPIYGFPPDLYIQQYYSADNDPYPGYIQWKGPNGDYIYTVRGAEPNFPTPAAHIYSMAEQQLAKDLEPYIIKGVLTPEELNSILDNNSQQVQSNGMNKFMGENSGQNIMQLLNMLLGIAGPILNKAKDGHLPQSVMDLGSMNKSLEKFAKNMSIVKKMKDVSNGAFNLPSALSGLLGGAGGGLGAIAGTLGSLGVSAGGLQDIGSLMNIISDGQSGFLSPEAAKIAATTGQTVTVSV